MLARGISGAGTAVAVVVPDAAPHAAADIEAYSRRWGLPAPRVRELRYGQVVRPSGSSAAGGEQEGTLDLEMAHALAPQATLIYLAVAPGTAMVGPEYDAALSWLVTRYRPTVVSYSEGIPEAWTARDGHRPIASSRAGLEAAARAGVTVVAASGDWGPTMPQPDGRLYSGPVTIWPASDPLVTAVGGTRLLPAGGAAASTVFAYTDGPIGATAGGAGLSAVFPRPSWQDPVRGVTGNRRGVADVSMDASPCSPVLAYTSTNDLPGQHPGWVTVSGTSVAAPLFAGIVADTAQIAGYPLGLLGPALYRMHGTADGVEDITADTNSMPGLPGYPARSGYDLPSGIGTVASAALFTAALARLARSRP